MLSVREDNVLDGLNRLFLHRGQVRTLRRQQQRQVRRKTQQLGGPHHLLLRRAPPVPVLVPIYVPPASSASSSFLVAVDTAAGCCRCCHAPQDSPEKEGDVLAAEDQRLLGLRARVGKGLGTSTVYEVFLFDARAVIPSFPDASL